MTERVEAIETPIELEYHYTAGRATARFLRELARGRLIGQRCPACASVIVPPRGACARCGVATQQEVELSGRGTVTTFCVVHIPVPGSEIKPPFVCATILLDGADIGFFHLVSEIPTDRVRPGLRVEAVWKPREAWGHTLENIRFFKPIGEPDVALDDKERPAHA